MPKSIFWISLKWIRKIQARRSWIHFFVFHSDVLISRILFLKNNYARCKVGFPHDDYKFVVASDVLWAPFFIKPFLEVAFSMNSQLCFSYRKYVQYQYPSKMITFMGRLCRCYSVAKHDFPFRWDRNVRIKARSCSYVWRAHRLRLWWSRKFVTILSIRSYATPFCFWWGTHSQMSTA